MKSLEEIIENYIPVTESGCWLWLGSSNKSGYGIISYLGKTWICSRFFWTHLRESIPKGLLVCHKCDTPLCVNPDHLFVGTSKDNSHDASAKGRIYQQKFSACIHGHELTGRNLIIRPGPVGTQRQCRKCQNEINKAFMRKFRAERKAKESKP